MAPNNINPFVNSFSGKYFSMRAIYFDPYLLLILQIVWEVDLEYGPAYISKQYILDEFHRYLIKMKDMGAFAYVVPPIFTDRSPIP